jgi:putative sterol carrier protein
MAHELFSPEWAQAYAEAIRTHAGYKKSAASWEWPMVFKVTADPSIGLPQEKAIYLDLFHGECREARVATEADLQAVPYIVSADAFAWKQVVEKKLEPIGGLMRGKLKLARGNMIALARYVQAAQHLVEAATNVETSFPEGVR